MLCVQGTKCRCNIQPAVALGLPEPNCFMNDYTCTSDKGCYLRRYYLQERGMIVQVWDCITDQYNVESQIDHVKIFCGYWNTPTDAYKCCNSTDLCNERLQITLPMETMSPTPSPAVSTSISPSSTVLHHSHMTHSGSHSSHSGKYYSDIVRDQLKLQHFPRVHVFIYIHVRVYAYNNMHIFKNCPAIIYRMQNGKWMTCKIVTYIASPWHNGL